MTSRNILAAAFALAVGSAAPVYAADLVCNIEKSSSSCSMAGAIPAVTAAGQKCQCVDGGKFLDGISAEKK